MTPTFRTVALAAMTVGAAVSAQAAPTVINIDFEALAEAAKKDGKPAKIKKEKDFLFAGATVYHVDQTTDPDGDYAKGKYPKPERKRGNGDGFIQNRDGANLNVTKQTISVQLVGALANDDIESISFDLAIGSQSILYLFAIGKDADGNGFREQFGPIKGGIRWAWRSLPVGSELDSFAGLGVINRIEFEVEESNGFIPAFALDNINVKFAGTGGGTVPEPAGLGLVALALAAAGLTTRKRRA